MVRQFKETSIERKRLLHFVMAVFVMAMALACTSIPADLHTGAATETVYAAQAVAISSEEDLAAMQENPDGNYYLAKDITIKGGSESVSSLL